MEVPRVDEDYREEIKAARVELNKLISEKKFSAPNLLRLAYASQFTIANYPDDDATPKTTQPANSTPNTTPSANVTPETTPSANATPETTPSDNFKNLKSEITRIKVSHPKITYPDLYQLAGVVAVEALEGGPKIEFVPGREESLISPDERYLPDVKQSPSDLRDAFAKVRISEPKHIVALCGGLKLDSTSKFDNSYFVDLNEKKDSSTTDKALLDDPKFLNYVQRYAKDNNVFIKDYKEAYKMLSELGLPHSSFIRKSKSLAGGQKEKAVGVAVAAIVVILSVFYLINRRRAKHSSQQFQ